MNKKILPLIAFFITFFALAQTPCENGFADEYPCDGFDLQSHISLSQMNASEGNDSWGWTDPQDGKEYAIIGLDNGTAFIDMSDPINPVYLGKLPTHDTSTIWRDIKVYNNYAFVVSESGDNGMQVFDLTRLRSVNNPPEIFTEDAHYDDFESSHNIIINEETGYAYAVGTNTYSGGPHFIDISDPLNPVAAGGFASEGYSHDAQVIVYDGPDTDYTGHEIYVGSHADYISIIDVTDKNNPQLISSVTYTNAIDSYTHQGWFTEDLKYFIVGDEADELNFGFNTKTLIFDFTDLDNPVFDFEHFGETIAIDHNGYTYEGKFYMANYHAGLRVFDISDIANDTMSEIGYFDTFPQNDSVGFSGSWNVYPFFESGNILISGNNGFTLVKSNEILANNDINDNLGFSLYPNPATNFITINSNTETVSSISIYDIGGKLLFNEINLNSTNKTVDISTLSKGIYFIQMNNKLTKKLIKD